MIGERRDGKAGVAAQPFAATAIQLSSARVVVLKRIFRNPMGALGGAIVGAIVIVALLAPLVAPYSPLAQHPGKELLGPGRAFLLGTDSLGRDVLSRVMYGARPSIAVGVVASLLGGSAGIIIGLMAGYLGGSVETILMRFIDTLFAFPPILTGIAILTVLGPGAINVAYALAIAGLPSFARLTRSIVLGEKHRDYVLSARALGARRGRIMFRHILPNSLGPLLVQLALFMGIAVLAEAGLSFLGLGTQPPLPSWGGMLSNSQDYLRTDFWIAIWPGIALALLVLGLNLLSDAMREALDPRRVNV